MPVYAYGPKAELFSGIYENTEIHEKMYEALGLAGDSSSSCNSFFPLPFDLKISNFQFPSLLMRQLIVAGNWKMNKTLEEGLELIESVLDKTEKPRGAVVFATPFVHLKTAPNS